ncbi:MAG: hypothetical protein ACRDCE_01590 [Cetobacterium sp.]|uniref:hypothetical protein n=1 Tax=Cetobacterium sp. TaxID=2071632 RepID=UPI003EE4802E
MKFYAIETNNGPQYFDIEKIMKFHDLPVMNEGDEAMVNVSLTDGTVHIVKKMSLFSAFVHAEIKVLGLNQEGN